MTCAMIVFYLVGIHLRADLPPIVTTLPEAVQLVRNDNWIKSWEDLGVYPVIKPCEEEL